MTDIRHIAAHPRSSTRFLTGAFEHRVRLWSFADRSLVAELETVLDFGGTRLALCGTEESPVVVAGAWERHGVCAYAPDGTRLWQRKDLRRPQHVAPAAGGSLAAACFDEGPMHVLAVESGETAAEVRGVRGFHDSPFGAVGLGELDDGAVALVRTDDWKLGWKAPLDGFAVLAAAAGPDALAAADVVDEGSASVSCFGLDGEALWRWEAPPAVNCRALAWDADANEWAGVLGHVENEQPDTLVRWSSGGDLVGERPIGLLEEYAFLPGGGHLVTSDGAVRDARDGSVVWRFAT